MGAALAGDVSALQPLPTFTWTGFYGGQTGGYTFTDNAPQKPNGFWDTALDAAGSAFNAASGGSQAHGYLGGGQLGFNYQIMNLVLGLESDLTYTGLATAASPAALTNGPTDSLAFSSGVGSHWLSTMRGRVGAAIDDRLLVYTTGGFAIAGRNFNNGYLILSPQGQDYSIGTAARTAAGVAFGGGLEYALTKNWTLKGEYLYTELGQTHTYGNVGSLPGGTAARMELDEKIVRAAINYKFDWFSAPAAK
ncbi:MAG: outer membrane protein [Methylovirgula sp.]